MRWIAGIAFSFLLLAGRAWLDVYARWIDQWMDRWLNGSIWTVNIAPSCRHQGRCLVEEGGTVTGWPLLACVALSGLALPLPRTYIDPLRAP